MKIIPEPLSFDWDKGNKHKNSLKHQVTCLEIETVFSNYPLIVHQDKTHSGLEQRFQALGQTNEKRKLFLAFTLRNNKVRVISARDMNKKEKQIYEEIK
jgi:uncharacterized protein